MKYAQLIRLLVGRELTLRYKRSVIGIGWTLLNPMLTSFVLWVVFSFVFASKLPGNQQYAPYLMAGILLNNLFSQGLLQSAESISANSHILTKIYVPPVIFILSSALSNLINFFIGLIPLALVVYISGQTITMTFPIVLIVGLLMVLLTTGIGLGLSPFFIRFDDLKNIINILLLILTYFTPIFYPITILTPAVQKIVNLNPLTSFLNIFRWAFSDNADVRIFDFIFVGSVASVAFVLGLAIFKKMWPRTVAML